MSDLQSPPSDTPRPGPIEGPLWRGNDDVTAASVPVLTAGPDAAPDTKPRARSRWFWWTAGSCLAAFAAYDLTSFVWKTWAASELVGGVFAALLSAFLVSAVFFVGAETREMRKLTKAEKEHDEAAALLVADGHGRAFALTERILRRLPVASEAKELFASSVYDTHDDRDVLDIFGRLVLRPLDQKAYAIIARAARGSAVGVAVSPLASLDALVTFWRSLRMIRDIAEVYGFRPSTPGTLLLARHVLLNSGLSAGADIVGSLWVDHLGHRLAGLVSTKLGEGVFVAIRVTRLGLLAMELCRPLPFGKDDEPSLTNLRKQLIADLSARS